MTFSIDTIIKNIIREELDLGKPINPSKKLKFPCSICNRSVMKNQKAANVIHVKNGHTSNVMEQLILNMKN